MHEERLRCMAVGGGWWGLYPTAHFTVIRDHPRRVEMLLIKTKCFIGSRDRVGGTRKINSRRFCEIHILINILLKKLQLSNEGALLHKRIPLFLCAQLIKSLKVGVFALDFLRLAVKQVGTVFVPTPNRMGRKHIIVFMSSFFIFFDGSIVALKC